MAVKTDRERVLFSTTGYHPKFGSSALNGVCLYGGHIKNLLQGPRPSPPRVAVAVSTIETFLPLGGLLSCCQHNNELWRSMSHSHFSDLSHLLFCLHCEDLTHLNLLSVLFQIFLYCTRISNTSSIVTLFASSGFTGFGKTGLLNENLSASFPISQQ